MKHLKTLVSAFFAGTIFSFGGIAYMKLADVSAMLAAVLFAGCLWLILNFDLPFFCGEATLLFADSKKIAKRFTKMLVTLVGNALGAVAIALVFSSTFKAEAHAIAQPRIEMFPPMILASAILCGFLLGMATKAFIKNKGNSTALSIVFFAAVLISVCEFTHAMTDFFFYSFFIDTVVKKIGILTNIAIGVFGNALGAVLFYLLEQFKKLGDDSSNHRHHHHHHHRRSSSTESAIERQSASAE